MYEAEPNIIVPKKMNILFFYVHPSKYHLFKNTIKLLEDNGHYVDIAISDKEVLSDLLDSAGVRYFNLFPNGRKSKYLSIKLNAFVGLFRTLWKLWLLTRKKKYDVYVTDDSLSILGFIQGVPSIAFTDNDLATVPLVKLIFKSADKILAPSSTTLDNLEFKKISFKGNKAIAHLSPVYFARDPIVLKKYNLQNKELFIIRLAKLNANHDVHGNPGITDDDLTELINLVPNNYDIIITSERNIPAEFKKYIFNIKPIDYTQILAHASFFIGDSSTMATEAAILGVPNILINNIAKKLNVLIELKEVYKIHNYFDTFGEAKGRLIEMLNFRGNEMIQRNAKIFINQSDDFNTILFNEICNLKKLEIK